MVISEVFHDPVPDAPLAGPVMLLEGLQAGIAGQLAVLDDAGLTGTGQSSADVMGVPGAVLADKLTGHLVREIIVRGSGGGPLAPPTTPAAGCPRPRPRSMSGWAARTWSS